MIINERFSFGESFKFCKDHEFNSLHTSVIATLIISSSRVLRIQKIK
jgi:hypothetical protein